MNEQLQDYMSRPRRYDNIDGTGEMAFGIMALGYTFLDCLQAVLPEDSTWRHGFASMVLFFAGVLMMLSLILWIPKVIKKRITWPRTGYVAYRRDGKSRWTVIVGTFVIAAGVAAGVVCLMRFDRRQDPIGNLWMAAVAIYAAGYTFWICRMGREHPWKWLVLLFMTLGLLAMALIAPAGFVGLWRPMLLFVGLTWLGSGGVTLCLYIRHTRPAATEAE
jgi:hypothetical protein